MTIADKFLEKEKKEKEQQVQIRLNYAKNLGLSVKPNPDFLFRSYPNVTVYSNN